LDFFLDTVMGFGVNGNYSDTSVAINQAVKEYLAYKDYRDLEAAINKAFPDTRALDEAIGNGFRYVKHYYPGFKTPRVYYINHILINLPAFCIDSTLSCVCLDMFLGADFQPYRSVGVPEYLNPHLSPKYVPVALFSALYEAKYPYRTADKTLLDLMIQKGKEQYFLHKVLPGTPDSVLFGFTGNQIEWCQKNEAFLYNYLIERNLLYSHEERAIMPYVNDGPFAHGIGSATDPGKPTPGNVGSWLGYRIVRAYAERHQSLTLPALMADRIEGAPFLEAANYKPR
ncbi:MAG: hypothetical protein EBZ77_14370, partial [Chitinophagia bacterium]|nr:hypothetical protein [Chitinophagia bacterium]